jgi:hypothetical protein
MAYMLTNGLIAADCAFNYSSIYFDALNSEMLDDALDSGMLEATFKVPLS